MRLCAARTDCRSRKSDYLVKSIINGVSDAVVKGEPVKLSGFGTFLVRHKRERMGRNPKTGMETPITPRRVLVFRPSQVMRDRINRGGGSEEQP